MGGGMVHDPPSFYNMYWIASIWYSNLPFSFGPCFSFRHFRFLQKSFCAKWSHDIYRKFCVKIFSLVMTVATMDDSVNYDTKITCAKIPVLNTLLLTRFTASPSRPTISIRSYFSWRVVFLIPKDRCQHVCQRQQSPLQTRRWRRLSWTKTLARSAVSSSYSW